MSHVFSDAKMRGLLQGLSTCKSERDPEAAVAAGNDSFARHPLTGAFTNPAVESALSVGSFRDAFPLHTVLLAAVLVIILVDHAAAFARHGLPAVWRAHNVLYLCMSIIALVGRGRIHRMQDQVRSQRLGSRLWTATVVMSIVGNISAPVTDLDRTCTVVRTKGVYILPFINLMVALVNGSHGMSFLHKTALVVLFLIGDMTMLGSCGERALLLSSAGAFVVGYVAAHIAELYMRRAFAEKHLEQERREQAETRQEQLQTAKERLQYDFNMATTSCRPTPADDNRRELRRGLQAGTGQSTAGDTDPSEAGGPGPSDSPPPSLPPGAPSSSAGSSTALPADGQQLAEGAVGVQSSRAADGLLTPEVTEAFLVGILADEEAVVALPNILTPAAVATIGRPAQEGPDPGHLPVRPNPEAVASYLRPPVAAGVELVAGTTVAHQCAPFHVIPYGVQEDPVYHQPVNRSQWQGGNRTTTPRQQALHVALQRAQVARTEIEVCQLVHTLATALGASRMERGTVKALYAVLIQMGRPGMSEKQAYSATGASMSNFKKWRKRVHHAQLDLPSP